MMINTPYNLPSSTLGQMALVAGALALQSAPAIAQQDIAKQGNKCMFEAAYRTTTNDSTYSPLSSLFTGEYNYSSLKQGRGWMTPGLAAFLRQSPHISLRIDYLLVAIRDTYGDVQIDTAIHTDPEEGWTKPVFIVHSGISDFDKLMDIEDSFFAKAASDQNLLAVLPLVVVVAQA